MKQELGRRAHWGFKSEVKKLLKKSNRAEEKMFSEDDRKQAIVSYLLRGEWSIADEDLIKLPIACAYVTSNDTKELLTRIDRTQEGAIALIKRLGGLVEDVDR